MFALQVIKTKYLGPTDFKPSRVKATAEAGSVTLSWDSSLDSQPNHERAARALMAKYDWGHRVVAGADTKGYYFVMIPKNEVIK